MKRILCVYAFSLQCTSPPDIYEQSGGKCKRMKRIPHEFFIPASFPYIQPYSWPFYIFAAAEEKAISKGRRQRRKNSYAGKCVCVSLSSPDQPLVKIIFLPYLKALFGGEVCVKIFRTIIFHFKYFAWEMAGRVGHFLSPVFVGSVQRRILLYTGRRRGCRGQ